MTKTKKPLIAALASFALAAALAGCVSIGHSFDTSKVGSIVLNKTTQAQIQQIFGTPTRTGTDDGSPTWTFLDYKISVMGLQRANDLYVKFNADGTVKSYSFNTNQ
ncbi:MAG TPA: outer membrane protein assembly factor BamE [Elusimicrobiota bacterium]|nr:outer membrane protein assembly factor BamE [Elusimicrobiota bacterium]